MLSKLNKKNIFFVGASLLLGCSILDAKAIVTHPLNYNTVAGSSGSLSGSITFDETSVEYGAALSDGSGNLPTWITNLTLEWDNGNGGGPEAVFDKDDFILLRWVKKTGVTPDYSLDLVPQFDNISFVGRTGSDEPSSGSVFEMNYLTNEYILASTPGPLPFAGFMFFISYIKKLKRTLKANH